MMRFQPSYGVDLYALPTPMKDRAAALRAFSLTPTLPRKPSNPAVSTLAGPQGTQTDGVYVYTAGYAPDETNTYSMQVIKVGDQRVVYEGEPEYNQLFWSGDGKGIVGAWKGSKYAKLIASGGDSAQPHSWAMPKVAASAEQPSQSAQQAVTASASSWYTHPLAVAGGTLVLVGLYMYFSKPRDGA